MRVLKRDTRHFAKRQLTWFRRERGVKWVELERFGFDREKVLEYIMEELERGSDNSFELLQQKE